MTTSLKEAIVAAFIGVAYPGDDRLTVYFAAGRDYDETFQLLRGKSWEELPVTEFITGDTPIPDLSPEAFHYYMPALLLASIDESVDRSSDVASSLIFYLSPSNAKQTEGEFPYDYTETYNRRMALFSEGQRAVMIRVLEDYLARGWANQERIAETVEYLFHPQRLKEPNP